MSTAALDWGDGTPVANIPIVGTPASWSIPDQVHTYASPGDRTITLTGPSGPASGGVDSKSQNIPPAPQFAGTATTGTTGSTAGLSVTVPKPAGLVNGETLVACLRGQVANAAEFICPGWRRISPDFDAASTSAPRVTVIMVKPVVDATAEPASYVFSRNVTERKDGIVFRVPGAGKSQPCGRDTTVGGSGVQGAGVTRSTGPYPITTSPALKVFAGGGEHTASNSDVPSVTPADLTQRGFVTSDPSISVSRTSLWAGTGELATGVTVPQESYACLSSSSGLAAVALRPPVDGYLFKDITAMLAKTGFTMGHRGNSVTYAEMSLNAYQNADAAAYSVLEISLARTSDGVWFGLHDADINRTSGLTAGTQPVALSMTWAQVQAFSNVLAVDGKPRPYARWEDLRDAFPKHLLMLDPKYAWINGGAMARNEFWDICAQVGLSRCIVKGFINSTSLVDAATARGYHRWGYGYQADWDSGDMTTFAPKWTMLGMEIPANTAAWNGTVALGKPVIAHIATSIADYKAGLSKGAVGVQVGASATVPAVNALS